MSESEKMGRCFNEVYECGGAPSQLRIADALDRLAADVASIKAKVDAVSPEDVAHLVESEKAFAELFAEQRDAAIRERDTAMAEVERLKAERAAPQPAAPPAGWLTEEERGALSRAFDLLCDDDGDSPLAGTVQALLSRAGSPPVVEVPVMVFGGGSYQMEKRYRAAMDKAGVAWKEVPRE